MSLTFAIAEQTIALPDGTMVELRTNQADTSQVEIHIKGDDEGQAGSHVLMFKRNGGPLGREFRPSPTADEPAPAPRTILDDDAHNRSQFTLNPSVDKDAVRGAPGEAKISPVHGKINTAGTDGLPVKPREGKNEDTPLQDRKDHAAVGLKPSDP